MVAAATSLRITQSAVSKRIAALQDRLGKRLILREGRRAVLTEEGRQLLDSLTPLLAEVQGILHREPAQERTVVRLGVSESILASWGSRLLAKAGPELELKLHAHRSPVVVDRVFRGTYGAGLVAGRADQVQDLRVVELGWEPMVLLGRGRKPPPPGVRSILAIEPRSSTWQSIAASVRRAGLRPEVTLESFFPLAQMARQGFGVALVPIGVVRAMGVSVSFCREPRPRIRRPISFVARRSTIVRPESAELLRTLQAGLEDALRLTSGH